VSTTGNGNLRGPGRLRAACVPTAGTVLAAVTPGAQAVSPALAWSNVPAGTKSFALLDYDPDAPSGSGWWHWVAYNIPADSTSLPAGAGDPKKNLMPPGVVQGRTDYGTAELLGLYGR
jgi:Raf kinase inhibitor-like YbhB/YbcL family protein